MNAAIVSVSNAKPIEDRQSEMTALLQALLPMEWKWSYPVPTMRRMVEARKLFPYKDAKRLFLAHLLDVAVERYGNKSQAAEAIGVSRVWIPMCLRRIGRPDLDPKLTPEANRLARAIAESLLSSEQNYEGALARFECEFTKAALEAASGNHQKAASAMRVHPNTVWNNLRAPKETK